MLEAGYEGFLLRTPRTIYGEVKLQLRVLLSREKIEN